MGPAGLPGEGPPALSPVLVRMLVLGVWALVPLSLSITPVLRPASLLCCPSQGCMPRAQNASLEGPAGLLAAAGEPPARAGGQAGVLRRPHSTWSGGYASAYMAVFFPLIQPRNESWQRIVNLILVASSQVCSGLCLPPSEPLLAPVLICQVLEGVRSSSPSLVGLRLAAPRG